MKYKMKNNKWNVLQVGGLLLTLRSQKLRRVGNTPVRCIEMHRHSALEFTGRVRKIRMLNSISTDKKQ